MANFVYSPHPLLPTNINELAHNVVSTVKTGLLKAATGFFWGSSDPSQTEEEKKPQDPEQKLEIRYNFKDHLKEALTVELSPDSRFTAIFDVQNRVLLFDNFAGKKVCAPIAIALLLLLRFFFYCASAASALLRLLRFSCNCDPYSIVLLLPRRFCACCFALATALPFLLISLYYCASCVIVLLLLLRSHCHIVTIATGLSLPLRSRFYCAPAATVLPLLLRSRCHCAPTSTTLLMLLLICSLAACPPEVPTADSYT